MGSKPLIAVIDIGTNSMRLLITDGEHEIGRWVEVTGLGRGVDLTGALAPDRIEETLAALAGFGSLMDSHDVERRAAIATSASRDASNREVFFDLAESALGVRPSLITGEEEARLAYAGATAGAVLRPPVVVSDIGGGSTEFVTDSAEISIDIGSVRLTERAIPSRPALPAEMGAARAEVATLFSSIDLVVGSLVGVAGTWTSLGALAKGLGRQSGQEVHGYRMSREQLADVTEILAGMTVEETSAIPALDPKRASVILGGSLVAEGVMDALAAPEVIISEHDTLDGVASRLLAIP